VLLGHTLAKLIPPQMYDPSKPSSSTLPNIPSQIVSINSFINEQDESKRENKLLLRKKLKK
jgi:hypothetical protein